MLDTTSYANSIKHQSFKMILDALDEVAPGHTIYAKGMDTTIEALEIDSVETMELVCHLEETIGSSFSNQKLSRVRRIRDLASLIEMAN